MSQKTFPEILERGRPLQVGFIPVSDCAPLAVARESGLFEKYELKVELRREKVWSGIRDKIIYGELDAAHAPATLPFVTNLGFDSDQCACVAGMVLSLQGNAITLSRHLRKEGVRDAESLRELIYRDWGKRSYAFGVVYQCSPPYFLLRQWLRSGGVAPNVEVRIIEVPSVQMFPTLKLGYIDGFCASEPWTSLAAEAQVGACVATSAELAPLHPEKVLMVRRDFAENRASEHERLIAALLEACAFCDRVENRPLLGEMLAQPHYVNAPADCLKHGFGYVDGLEHPNAAKFAGLSVFHRDNANDPTDDKGEWVVSHLYELMDDRVLRLPPTRRAPVLKNVFRRDIYLRAKALVSEQARAVAAEAERYEAGVMQAGQRANR